MDTVLTLGDLRSAQRVHAERAAFEMIPVLNMLMREEAENISKDLTSLELIYRGEIHLSMQPTLVAIFHRAGWHVEEFRPADEGTRPPATVIKINWTGER